jgi:membrane protein DedA with SNARE-associated domain
MKVGPLLLAVALAAAVAHRRRRLPPAMLVLAAATTAGLTAYGLGVIDPPSLETAITDLTSTLGSWAYVIVGALAFAETGAGVGLVAPGEFAVILGGVSAGQGELELVPLIAIVWACALAGDLTSYALGRRLGREFILRHGHAIGISRERLEQTEGFFAAHGGKTIIIGRFIGLVRALTPLVAGASRMPARRFIPCTALAAGIWAATFCTLGYAFWQSLDQLLAVTKDGTLALAVAIAVLAGATVIYRRRLRSRAT